MTQQCDVLVIGGGPAGSTISHLLADKGHKVVLLEKDHHPRFHIGESLLPMNMPILEKLGLLDEVLKMGVKKNGADFTSPEDESATCAFYFEKAMDKTNPSALQVRRAEFDLLLLERSKAKGTDVREGIKVTDVTFRKGKKTLVSALDENQNDLTWEAGFVVDASGRETFLSGKFKFKEKNPHHQSAAIFGHFKNVERRKTEKDEGNISIYWFDSGWVWVIPLPDGNMSVGAVCWPEYLKSRNKPLEEFLRDTFKRSPTLNKRMLNAELVNEVRATGNFAYTSKKMYGDGYMMVGDAYTFLDPVFSAGVYMAMSSANTGAKIVDTYLRNPREGLIQAEAMEREINKGLKVISWFIYRFTSPVMRKMFLRPDKTGVIESAVISVLAGDFFGGSRIGRGIFVFKFWYYFLYLMDFPAQWKSFLLRKRNVHEIFDQGTTPQDNPEVMAG